MMDLPENILPFHRVLGLAMRWARAPDSCVLEDQLLSAMNCDALVGAIPLPVVLRAMVLAPWTISLARESSWSVVWLRHTMMTAHHAPCPAFHALDPFSLMRAGAWLRGKGEQYGLGITPEQNAALLTTWEGWTSAGGQKFFTTHLGMSTLHFVLRGEYLHDALYPNTPDSLGCTLSAIWPASLYADILYGEWDQDEKLLFLLKQLAGTDPVLKNSLLNLVAHW